MNLNKKPNIFDYEMPIFSRDNKPNKSPNLIDARFFAMEVTNVKFSSLNDNEKAFFHYIESNTDEYDITFRIKGDDTIIAKIGSFDSDIIYNNFYLWIPFIVIAIVANNSHILTNIELSFNGLLFNSIVCLFGIAAVPSKMFIESFDKQKFFKWYSLLIIITIGLSVFFNF